MNEMIFQKIKQSALEENIPIIMDETLETMKDYLMQNPPKRFLEIGTAVGYSAICFSQYLAMDGIIDTIEMDEERARQAIENIKAMELEQVIHVIQGNAVEILPTLTQEYDVVFIDAAKAKYPFFLQEAIRLVKQNGWIMADNILYKGYVLGDYNKHKQRTAVTRLREYLKTVMEDERFETTLLEVGDGLVISRLKRK